MSAPVVTPEPSATVLLLREASARLEVLMVRRPAEFRFMGGLWVFPGGRVDAEDRGESDPLGVYRAAACRETREEVGVELSPATLVHFGHWITPVVARRRFETRFFLARLPEGQSIRVDPREVSEHAWLSPGDGVEAQRRGTMSLSPPTLLSLIDLGESYARHGRSLAALLEGETRREVLAVTPRLLPEGERVCALMPWDDPEAQPQRWPEHLRRLPGRLVLPPEETALGRRR